MANRYLNGWAECSREAAQAGDSNVDRLLSSVVNGRYYTVRSTAPAINGHWWQWWSFGGSHRQWSANCCGSRLSFAPRSTARTAPPTQTKARPHEITLHEQGASTIALEVMIAHDQNLATRNLADRFNALFIVPQEHIARDNQQLALAHLA